MNVVDKVIDAFAAGGQVAYFGEAVSQTEHALQTAHLARTAGAGADLVVAALLHDLGHLLHGLPETIAEQGTDARHEEGGAAWLGQFFGPTVTDPIRLHVAAKRYLCVVDPDYLAQLSPASQRSLQLQGGPFDSASLRLFEQEPHARAAVALRRWDDAAKVPGLVVPGLEHYRPFLEAALRAERERMGPHYDAAVVGAGILGLAHAYHLARGGARVVVFERHARAQGASVRNFGMLWPIGQPAGALYQLARRSLEIWLEVLRAAGLWHARAGSLHLAYHDDEAQVLREFVAESAQEDRGCQLLTAAQVRARSPAVRPEGLRTGMWSATEVTVDPRQVVAELPAWLSRQYGVAFVFNAPVLSYERPRVVTAAGEWAADRLLVCTGADFRELAPDAFADCGLVPCKLQMLRSPPCDDRVRLGTMLAAGLTLRHYKAFARCPSLPALVRRLDAELPEYGRYGIHVLAAQNGLGELVLGDSHEYGDAIEPFDKAEIDDLILAYLRTFLAVPDLRIAARWHGIYVKHPTEAYVIARPRPGMTAVTGVGGAGMTLSFGLAEQVVAAEIGESHDH